MDAKKQTQRPKGRPEGSKTADRDVVTVLPSRCVSCGSTDRDPYCNTRTVTGDGIAPDGGRYTAVELSNTRCRHCGQCRVDRRYQYVPDSDQ